MEDEQGVGEEDLKEEKQHVRQTPKCQGVC